MGQDGDPKKSLYPAEHRAAKLTQVKGPDPNTAGNTWHIEGRSSWTLQEASETPALTDGAGDKIATTDAPPGMSWVEVGGIDRGLIGAQYRINLHVAGKYRMVNWERLSGKTEDADTATALANA